MTNVIDEQIHEKHLRLIKQQYPQFNDDGWRLGVISNLIGELDGTPEEITSRGLDIEREDGTFIDVAIKKAIKESLTECKSPIGCLFGQMFKEGEQPVLVVFKVDDGCLLKSIDESTPPFSLPLLQRAAWSALSMPPIKTMEIAKTLFDQGLITYYLTDSYNLSGDSIAHIVDALTKENLPISKDTNKWKTKEEDGYVAYEAIRPVDCTLAFAGDTQEEQSLYRLIRQRTFDCLMSNNNAH